MAQGFRLQPLLDLTDHRLDAATLELQRLRARLEQEQARYAQLQGFDAEYRAGFQSALQAGLEADRLRDYREFLEKLSRALSAQAEEVVRWQRIWEEGLARWQDLRQRQQALTVLKTRHAAEQVRREARVEQKQQDEFARRPPRREG
jgi:flagellar FliJ protein